MNKFEKEIINLLNTEGLNNMQIYFADYDTFEELPLFSRWKNIDFLKDLDFDEKNKILIQIAIKLIEKAKNEIPSHLQHEVEDYFICVSITSWEDIDEINCLTPAIFISRKARWILSCLELQESEFSEKLLIDKYMKSLGLDNYKSYTTKDFSSTKDRIYLINKSYSSLIDTKR
jgi:hypothetical protein